MEKTLTVVVPAYSDISVVRNSVVSLVTQWIPTDSFRLEVLIVNDNPERDYTYFLSDEFMRIASNDVVVRIINNSENYGQGISRQIGIDNAVSNWVLLCDEDDMYAPNALYRFWEILNEQHCGGNDGKPVALLSAPLYSFDVEKHRRIIDSRSIWVNAKLYNRQFLRDNCIAFPTGKNSHRSEDYPFAKMLDYAIDNNSNYKRIDFDDTADTFYYWIPNLKSRTHVDKFYTALLTPFTLNSSCMIYEYYKWYNELHNIVKEKDEFMKMEILNMNVYSYFNYLSWMKEMSLGWKDDPKCLSEDWELYKVVLNKIRTELKVYWDEITPSDVWQMLTGVKNNSDVRFVESWIGSFESWVENGHPTMNMSFTEIKKYCSKLKFDDANHEIHSSYVKAWKKRHDVGVLNTNK